MIFQKPTGELRRNTLGRFELLERHTSTERPHLEPLGAVGQKIMIYCYLG